MTNHFPDSLIGPDSYEFIPQEDRDDLICSDDDNDEDFNNIDFPKIFGIKKSGDIEEKKPSNEKNIEISKETQNTSKEIEVGPSAITNSIKFWVYKPEKRGRKVSLEKLNYKEIKIHKGSAEDNILTKLKVHMLNFGKNFANDIKNSCIGLGKKIPNFLDIDYKIKRNITKTTINEFIEKINENEYKFKYKEIFTNLPISQKNQGIKKIKIEENPVLLMKNKEIYESVCKEHPILNEFFEQGFMEVIEKYYLLDKKICNNIFIFKDLKIKLSPETETFWNLLDKNDNKKFIQKYNNVLFYYFKLNLKKGGN